MKKKVGRPAKEPLKRSVMVKPAAGIAPPQSPPKDIKVSKLAVFQRALADKELAMAEPEFDGGGTESYAPVSKESLERRVARDQRT